MEGEEDEYWHRMKKSGEVKSKGFEKEDKKKVKKGRKKVVLRGRTGIRTQGETHCSDGTHGKVRTPGKGRGQECDVLL